MSSFGQGAVIAALKGQTLRIPDLTALFRTWSEPCLNRHYPSLAPLVTRTIQNIAASSPSLSHIERHLRDDIALLACLLYPTARRPEIDALVLFTVWIMCWDDTVHTNEGDLSKDFAKAEEWRAKTLDLVRVALGLAAPNNDSGQADAINAVFLDFGRRFTEGGASLADRWRMFDQTSIYINACAVEQKLRLVETVPDYDAYMAMREGTIGGGMFAALISFAMNQDIPSVIAESPQVEILRKQVCILLSLLNDVLSLKKELKTECVINVVPALLTPETPLDEIVAQIYQKLRDAVHVFDEAAGELINATLNDGNLLNLTRDVVDGYRAIVTGTLQYTLKSPRYNLSQLMHEDGSLEIIL